MEKVAQSAHNVFEIPDGWDRDGRPPSIALLETISTIEGTDPTDLDFTLFDIVDPGALDQLLLDQKQGYVEVDLQVNGHLVTIRGDGSLRVEANGHE